MKKTFYLLAILFLLYFVAIPSHALAFSVIYSGKNTVDLSIGTLESNHKYELHRGVMGDALIHAWDTHADPDLIGRDVYRADTAPGQDYQLWTYYGYEEQGVWKWSDEPFVQSITSIDPTVESGVLHNDFDWCGKLGRDSVVWSGSDGTSDGTYYIKHVELADGLLLINDAFVAFDAANNEEHPSDVSIEVNYQAAIGATNSYFDRPDDQTNNGSGELQLVNASGKDNPPVVVRALRLRQHIRCRSEPPDPVRGERFHRQPYQIGPRDKGYNHYKQHILHRIRFLY